MMDVRLGGGKGVCVCARARCLLCCVVLWLFIDAPHHHPHPFPTELRFVGSIDVCASYFAMPERNPAGRGERGESRSFCDDKPSYTSIPGTYRYIWMIHPKNGKEGSERASEA